MSFVISGACSSCTLQPVVQYWWLMRTPNVMATLSCCMTMADMMRAAIVFKAATGSSKLSAMCCRYYVLVLAAIIPFFAVANAYGTGLTDFDMSSVYGTVSNHRSLHASHFMQIILAGPVPVLSCHYRCGDGLYCNFHGRLFSAAGSMSCILLSMHGQSSPRSWAPEWLVLRSRWQSSSLQFGLVLWVEESYPAWQWEALSWPPRHQPGPSCRQALSSHGLHPFII